MTALSARAQKLSPASKKVFPFQKLKPQNTGVKFENRKGLDIQPFIFALTACLPDIETTLGLATPSPTHRTDAYKQNRQHVIDFERLLMDAGYSTKGNPYWVGPQGPSATQIDAIATMAETFLPALNERYYEIFHKNNIPEIKLFQDRLGAYQAAINELHDVENARRYTREHLTQYPELVTALA